VSDLPGAVTDMSEKPDRLSDLSPGEKRQLLARLLKEKAQSRTTVPTYGQRALWLIHRMDPASSSYNVPWTWKVRSEVNVDALRRAFQALVDRHRILRTSYPDASGQPVLRVHETVAVDFEQVNSASWSDDEMTRCVSEEAHRPFDLENGPVLRVRLFTRTSQESILLVTQHHIAYDLWSMMTLLNELGIFYAAAVAGQQASLPAPHAYEEFAQWQADLLAGPEGERLWNYWRTQMAGDIPPLSLPLDRARPAVQISRGATHALRIPDQLGQRLRQLAQSSGHTLFTLLLSAFQVLLSRYSGEHDIVVGSPMTGRTRPDLQDVIGYCLNMVPLRGDLSGDPSFTEVLRRLRTTVLGGLEHQDFPLALLVERLRPRREGGQGALFHVMFALNKPHRREDQSLSLSMEEGAGQIELGGLQLEFIPIAEQGVVDDLVLLVSEIDDSLSCRWQYNSDLFDASTIARMAGHFERLLESIVRSPETNISDLCILADDERRELTSSPHTVSGYPERAIHRLFDEQAAKNPDAIAAQYGADQMTYAELQRRADRMARLLRARGVSTGALVGLLVERSLDMIVGMLGILKAGGAYVPLDPSYPQSRLAFMIADAGVPIVVTTQSLLERLPDPAPATICFDRDAAAEGADADLSSDEITSDHAAYVIYTSGSTGKPKGVVIPHRGVVRLVCNTDYVALDPSDRIAQASNASFDAATFEIWGALLTGACVVGIEKDLALSPRAFADELHDRRITALFLTTALFNQMAREAPGGFRTLRHVMFGGEAVDPGAVRHVLANNPPARLLHVYGPTESTTFSSWHLVQSVADDATTVPIGGPIAYTQLYVLDQHLEPVPVGVAGELYIGGDGLAHVYHGRPELTADRFVPDPFSAEPGKRLYRTGDLVRWSRWNSVEFLGRVDHQVKIRGFRIEPGEIEAVLRQHPAVRETLVDVRDLPGSGRSLVAYVVLEEQTSSMNDVRGYLRERLPEYMVPSAWVTVDSFPLTPNGKINRAALPAPDSARLLEEDFVAPQAGLEEQIASIWRDVLHLDRVGTRDNFFDLGGHSLLAVQVHARLRDELRREFSIVDLFRYPTVEGLARHLAGDAAGDRAPKRAAHVSRRAVEVKSGEAIAVIGMAGRFPGAADLGTFWTNLRSGVESIRFFSDEELRQAGVEDRVLADPRYVRARAVIDGVDLFDAAFFGYSPRDAELIDPQQRLFLECASEALERAGYDPDRYQGAVGVYAGSSLNGYLGNILSHAAFAGSLPALIGAGPDFLTTRVSYKLNLRGPSVTVQTACSTSLVAVHHACRSLLDGECDMALAGGVSIGVPVIRGHLHQEGGILSPDGHCRAFDASARGTVTGHGVGIVVLKRLSAAVADGDTIHAVIRGTAINNDGSGKIGYTAPSVEGQADVIARAHHAAGIEPSSVSYVEAHGTGTSLGDPIEMTALMQVFTGDPGTCALGSLKTNVGHLDAAAGVASLIKTVLSLEHAEIPPSLHFTSPNPKIDFDSGPFAVNTSLTPWSRSAEPRRAGVSSFGIGGTNAHAVVEEAPAVEASGPSRPWQLLLLSARTRNALEASTAQLAGHLRSDSNTPLADVAYTLQVGRRIFEKRRFVVCRAAADAAAALSAPESSAVVTGTVEQGEKSLVFMFSGQGAQYAGMARELYDVEPQFRADVDACCDILRPHLGWDLREALVVEPNADIAARLKETRITQPALFVVEYALARLWMNWGIRPAALIGHSVGEYVAACLAGVFSLEDALRLVAVRGQLMQSMPAGAMLAVPLPETAVQPLLGQALSYV
jgi:amino acid adenylation domain-containing protein